MDTDLTRGEFKLINSFQRGFPLVPRPFAAIAAELDMDESTVIETLQRLQAVGMVSRVGAIIRPHAIGASALAALAVPPERLAGVARYVSAFAEINHNYERGHRFNLWFVATAPSAERLRAVLAEIEDICECGPVLVLPLLQDYHIDLGFNLETVADAKAQRNPASVRLPCVTAVTLSSVEQILVAALQDGLPLVDRPFACLGLAEADALGMIARWLDDGVIKRFGVIVRHHELGYTANAMTVWDVPEADVDNVGRRVAASGRVTLCYRRPRRLPAWPYNLFCMIHGKDRTDVEAQVAALAVACGLDAYSHDVLFSLRRFKQRGAHYAALPAELREATHGRD